MSRRVAINALAEKTGGEGREVGDGNQEGGMPGWAIGVGGFHGAGAATGEMLADLAAGVVPEAALSEDCCDLVAGDGERHVVL